MTHRQTDSQTDRQNLPIIHRWLYNQTPGSSRSGRSPSLALSSSLALPSPPSSSTPTKTALMGFLTFRSHLDSIAVSVFVDWLSLSESEANPNNNLMMRQAGLSSLIVWQASFIPYSLYLLSIGRATTTQPALSTTTSASQLSWRRLKDSTEKIKYEARQESDNRNQQDRCSFH